MCSSSGMILFLLLYVALGAVVEDGRNFIQAPAFCEPPFALINDRCVFVVEREDSGELRCIDDSGIPCHKEDYPSKSLLPKESVSYEDDTIDGNNKNQFDERSFTGIPTCKQGYVYLRGRCRQLFNGVANRIEDMLTQDLVGEVKSVDSQIEDIYNIQMKPNQADTETEQRNLVGKPNKCRPGYRPDMKGRCREVFKPVPSNFQNERNADSASTKGFTQVGSSICRPGYRPDWKGNCREIFVPASGNSAIEDINHSNKGLLQVGLSACKPGFIRDEKGNCREIFTDIEKVQNGKYWKSLIPVATSGCKYGYRLDSKGRCREIFTPVNSNSQKEDGEESESTKGFIQVPGCAAGSVLIHGNCRPVFTGKREVYGVDYVDTNESPLKQPDLLRRRRRRSLNHQGHLYSGSEE